MSADAVLAGLILAAWIWAVGGALAPAWSAAERIAAGVVAACALGWLAMALGAVGVGLLGSTAATAGIGLLAAVAAVVRARPTLRIGRPAVAPLVVAIGAGILLTAPAFHLAPLEGRASHGDMIWHLGWIDQLRAGLAAPGGLYAGEPNGYPWLYHAMVAWIAAALPGTVTDSIEVVQVLGIATAAVGVWLLARATGAQRSASTWAVGIFLTAGAFGWVPHLRAEPSVPQALVALGICVPLGLAGLALLVRRRSPSSTDIAVMIAVPAIALLFGATIGQWNAFIAHGGPTPLVRWLRYLPFLVL